ncbi:hypothetical protein L204_104106 [Cryptococcus depauperatus]|nr:hypothetical protein L204_03259 [Cryptococcus depauperatus CBS 7855]
MPHRTVSISPSSSASISRPQESQVEILYNTAVQSFVRRDHVKTQATLNQLLDLLKRRNGLQTPWYTLEGSPKSRQAEDRGDKMDEEWMIKTLKLLISSTASLYTDPPSQVDGLPQVLVMLLPPASPKEILSYLQHRCTTAYYRSAISSDQLLPPQLISTLILASLKLSPVKPALDFAHSLVENWFTNLSDSFILTITPSIHRWPDQDALERKRIECAREGYLRVVELFVGEVLSREGEWEMAKGFLEGEDVMGSKKKEALFKHLRTLESKPINQFQPTSSPSSSLVLPASPLPLSLPSSQNTQLHPERSTSTSSSSSEATARPHPVPQGLTMRDRISRLKAGVETGSKTNSEGSEGTLRTDPGGSSKESPLNKQMFGTSFPISTFINSFSDKLPAPVSQIVSRLVFSRYILALPIPLIIMILTLLRRRRQRRLVLPPASPSKYLEQVQAGLNRARANDDWLKWIWYYLTWWLGKFRGVWRMGTTITYV